MSPDKKIQFEFVKDLIRNGEKRNTIVSKFVKRWQKTSDRTVDRLIKVAKVAIDDELKEIGQKTKDIIEKEVDARRSKILTVIERQEILSMIARGEMKLKKYIVCDKYIEEKEVVPDFMDRKNAIAELNKMSGDYAPIKTELSGNISQINISRKIVK